MGMCGDLVHWYQHIVRRWQTRRTGMGITLDQDTAFMKVYRCPRDQKAVHQVIRAGQPQAAAANLKAATFTGIDHAGLLGW